MFRSNNYLFECFSSVATAEKEAEETHLDKPIEENLNRLQIEGEARSVEAAISVLKYVVFKSKLWIYLCDAFMLI